MAAEQQTSPGQSVLEVIRGYAILVVLVIVVQVALAFFIVRTLIVGRREGAQKETLTALEELKEPTEEVALPDKPAKVYDIKEDLLTNAADSDRLRYVKAHVQLGVTPEKAYDEIEQIEPKVIDTILGILMSRTVEEMDDPADREVIKDEVKITINKYLKQGEVVKVYLTAFLIQ